MDKLNIKQQLFVAEYLKDFCGKRAAIAAGYSPGTAEQVASRMLRMNKVAASLAKAKKKRIERVQVDADTVLELLHIQATADTADILSDTGEMLPIKQWPLHFRQMVNSFDVVEGIPTKIKLTDRSRLLQMLGRHVSVSAFRDQLKVEADTSLVAYLEAAHKRVRQRKRLDADGNVVSSDGEKSSES